MKDVRGSRTTSPQGGNGVRAVSTVELLGFVTVFGRDFLQTVDPERCHEIWIARTVYQIPSPALLGELAKFGDLGSATPANRTQLGKNISRMLNGGTPIRSTWLRDLGDAMGMTDTQIGRMCELFSEQTTGPRVGDRTDTKQVIEAIKKYEKIVLRNRRRNENSAAIHLSQEEQATEERLRTACTQALRRLETAPEGYPSSMNATRLAQALPGIVLPHGWEKEYSQIQGLYSNIKHGGTDSILDLLGSAKRTVLLGDPGHGKSTALAAAASSAEAVGNFVLFAHLEYLDEVARRSTERHADMPSQWTEQWAAEMVVEAAIASGLLVDPKTRDLAIRSVLTRRHVFVALDGWDEIKSDKSVATRVVGLISAAMPGTLVLTSRVTGYRRPLPEAQELLVCPMTTGLAEKFFDERLADSPLALERARTTLRSPTLASMATVPVLANFVAFVAETTQPSSSVHGLYRQYVNLFLERRGQRSHARTSRISAASIEETLNVASKVAWYMATQPAPLESGRPDMWTDYLSISELLGAPDVGSPSSIEELAFSDGLLVPHGIIRTSGLMDQEYRWIHRTVQEHLAARALMFMVRANHHEWRRLLRNASLRPAWAQTLEHFFGLMKDAGLFQQAADEILRFSREGDDASDRLKRLLLQVTLDFGDSGHLDRLWKDFIKDLEVDYALKTDEERTEKYFAELDMASLSSSRLHALMEKLSWGRTNGRIQRDLVQRIIASGAIGDRSLLRASSAVTEPLTSYRSEPKTEGWLCEPAVEFDDIQDVHSVVRLLEADINRPDLENIILSLAISGDLEGFDTGRMLTDATKKWGMANEIISALWETAGRWQDLETLDRHIVQFLVQGDAPYMLAYNAGVHLAGQIDCNISELSPWARAGYLSVSFHNTDDLEKALSLEQARQVIRRMSGTLTLMADPPQPHEIEMFWLSLRVFFKEKDSSRLPEVLDMLFRSHTLSWPTWWLKPLSGWERLLGEFRWPEIRGILEEMTIQNDGSIDNSSILLSIVDHYSEYDDIAYEYTKLYLREGYAGIYVFPTWTARDIATNTHAVLKAVQEAISSERPPMLWALKDVLQSTTEELHDADLLQHFWSDLIAIAQKLRTYDFLDRATRAAPAPLDRSV